MRTGRLVAIAINTDIRTAGLLGYTALTSLLLLAILSNREIEGRGDIIFVINLTLPRTDYVSPESQQQVAVIYFKVFNEISSAEILLNINDLVLARPPSRQRDSLLFSFLVVFFAN